MALSVHLLGRFAVQIADRPCPASAWRRSAAAKMVKLLALAPGHRVHRDQMVDLLWPSLEPQAGANNFYRALHLARQALEPALPATRASRYLRFHGEVLMLSPPVWTDVEEFQAAAQVAKGTRDPNAFSTALALYTGELLPDDRYDDWIVNRRDILHREYADLLRDAALTHEALGDIHLAIDLFRQLVMAQPTDEDAHASLMRLLVLAGRRDEALRQFEVLRAALRSLDTTPLPSTRALYRELQAGSVRTRNADARSAVVRVPSPRSTNLPASLTSFIGRDAESAHVRALLERSRLVSLTGAAGCGKTRLALEVAASLAGGFADGAWLVELAPVLESSKVTAAVARALDVLEQPGYQLMDTVAERLRNQRLLLVLDNCEHVVDGCALVVETLLRACPWVRVLATSRERLHCAGELTWLVPPLLLPDPDQPLVVDALSRYDAIRLFVARARTTLPDFELNLQNAPAVAQICRRLDGIPLAIELAVARLQMLSPDEVAALLDDLLGLLSYGPRTIPARHQTVRSTLDWSFGMLEPADQAALRAVSVFTGGFTRGAAEHVTGGHAKIGGQSALDLLTNLVDKSLVQIERTAHGVRYSLLEIVRQYGIERMRDAAEELEIRHRHRDWCLEYAEEGAVALDGPGWTSALESIDSEAGNLHAALAGCQERGEIDYALRLAGALWRYWFLRGEISEGRRWVEALLADSGLVEVDLSVRVRAMLGAGWFAFHQGDLGTAASWLTQSMELGDDAARATALLGLGNVAEERGDYDGAAKHYRASLGLERQLGRLARVALVLDHLAQLAGAADHSEEALQLADEALELRRSFGDELGVARALCNRGIALAHLGRLDAAERALSESVRLRRRLADALGLAMATIWLGMVVSLRGDPTKAAVLQAEGLTISRARGVVWGLIGGFIGMSLVLHARGDPEKAAQLVGCAEALVDSTGIVIKAGDQAIVDNLRRDLSVQLGDSAFESARRAGRALPRSEAIDLALAVCPPEASSPIAGWRTDSGQQGRLTAREREIAAMLVRGDTNSQIAAAFSLSRRTVDTHVGRILQKRGVSSRTQLAAPL